MQKSPVSTKNIEVDLQVINERYMDLWSRFAKEGNPATNRYPLQYPKGMNRGSLLFVGCNPSFAAPDNIKPKHKTGLSTDMKEEDFYKCGGELSPLEFRQSEQLFLDSMTREDMLKNQYFGILKKVCDDSGMTHWEHIDLFGIRMTKQTEVLRLLEIRNIGKDEEEVDLFELPSFAAEQVDIAFETIRILEPSAIVVISAIGSRIFKDYANKKLAMEWAEDVGTYMITIGEKRTPVFLSGMLAMGRALDVFSRERLVWHIRRAHTFQKENTKVD